MGNEVDFDWVSGYYTVLERKTGAVEDFEATEVLTIAHNFKPQHAGHLGFSDDGKDEMIEDFIAAFGSPQDVVIEDVPAADRKPKTHLINVILEWEVF